MRSIVILTAFLVFACFLAVPACAQSSGNESAADNGARLLFYENFDNGSRGWYLNGYQAVNENHNTFLSGGWSNDNIILLNRQLTAADFSLKAKFRINEAGRDFHIGYRFHAANAANAYLFKNAADGYFLFINRTDNSGGYRASLEKHLDGAVYQLGSREIYLNDAAEGTWHQAVIEGRGSLINAFIDGQTAISVSDDQDPILGGTIYFSATKDSETDLDDVEIWAKPGNAYIPASITDPDWHILGVTILKATFASDSSYWYVDFFPVSRFGVRDMGTPGYIFSCTLFGFEVGSWGLALMAMAYLVAIIAIIIGITEIIVRLAGKSFKRMNRSVNRTVIKGKARIYRAQAKSDRDAAAGDAMPSKKIVNDVFISYAHEDKNVAELICANLESRKIRCWIAPRDVPAGENYQAAIIDAIDSSSIMVLVFSAASNESPHVIREITRAVSNGVLLIPFRIENAPLSKSMEYLISVPHWMEATEPPMDDNIDRLAIRVISAMKGEMPGEEKPGNNDRPGK